MESKSEDDDEQLYEVRSDIAREQSACYDLGEQPSADLVERVEDWEKRNRTQFDLQHIHLVIWGFFKWHDLGYDDGEF